MYRARVLGAAAVCWLIAGSASAQLIDGKGVAYRRWDVQGGVSLHVSTRADGSVANGSYAQWEPAFAGTLEVGRYWTSHLETELGVVFLTSHQGGGQEPVTVPTGQSGTAYITSRVRQTQFTFAVIHQFGENAFVHPYVSVGARVGLLDINQSRWPRADVFADGRYVSYAIPALDRHFTDVRVRPYAALGSKSYFSERIFVRPEVMLAFGNRGLGQYALRAAFGVDF